MAAEAGLAVNGLRFEAAGKRIVAGVSFEVAGGETLAILGPSGCGKTTLLRLIAGLERPTAGSLVFDGEEMANIPAHRRGFGMMFQDFALFPHLSVGQNVLFGLRRTPLARDARSARVTSLLERVGLAGFERRRVDSLSGGERQRVALARALAPEPRLLMLDEPIGSLDRRLRERLLVELKETLAGLSIPAIYVTHDQFEAFTIADHLAVMRSGEFVRSGTPEEVYAEPESEFVARFLGFENIIDGVSDGAGTVTTGLGKWPVSASKGPVRLLLRGEGVRLAEGGGSQTIAAVIESVAFQGANVRVRFVAGDTLPTFALPGSTALPPVGSRVSICVPTAQIVRGEDPGDR